MMATSLGISSKGETVAPAFPGDRFLLDPLSTAGLRSASQRRAPPPAACRAAGWGLVCVRVGEGQLSFDLGVVTVTPAASRCGPAPDRNPTPRAVDGSRRRGGGCERPGPGKAVGEPGGGRAEPTQPPAPCLSDWSLRAAKPPGALSRLQKERSWPVARSLPGHLKARWAKLPSPIPSFLPATYPISLGTTIYLRVYAN